jgi:hypothetical protein
LSVGASAAALHAARSHGRRDLGVGQPDRIRAEEGVNEQMHQLAAAEANQFDAAFRDYSATARALAGIAQDQPLKNRANVEAQVRAVGKNPRSTRARGSPSSRTPLTAGTPSSPARSTRARAGSPCGRA